MFHCAETLGKKGVECALYGFDTVSDRASSTRCYSLYDCLINSSAVILPLPLTKDGLTVGGTDTKIRLCDVFEKCPDEVPLFAGSVSEKARVLAREYGREIFDYYDDEVLTEKNALATAEGAVMLLMNNSERTLFGSECLVSGYGRIGKYTARLLRSLGVCVSVCARRKVSLACAVCDGCSAVDTGELSKKIRRFDFIINTVPANIFTDEIVSKMSASQKYIELASAPYGTERKIADKYNIEIIDGSALPSRYCPESAGEYIADKLWYEFERSGIV